MTVLYNDTGFFKAVTTPTARTPSTATFTGRVVGSTGLIIGAVALETGKFKFPILSKSDEVKIELQSDSYLPCAFQSAEWEGFFVLRSRKM